MNRDARVNPGADLSQSRQPHVAKLVALSTRLQMQLLKDDLSDSEKHACT